jgi:hypothetical protein
MAAFWAIFTFGRNGTAITAHGSLDLKREIQIYIQIQILQMLNLQGFFFNKDTHS